jgi:hypothetical protein
MDSMRKKAFFALVPALLLALALCAPALAGQTDRTQLDVINYSSSDQVTAIWLEETEGRTDLVFTLNRADADLAFLGRSFAAAANAVAQRAPDGSFTLPLAQYAEPFAVSFHCTGDGTWHELQFRLYPDFGQLDVFDSYGAIPTNQRLTVDGVEYAAEIYNIGGSNYFKLRSIAALLSGSAAQFDVDYDADAGLVLITTGAPYAAQAGDLAIGADKSESAIPTMQGIRLNGEIVYFDNVYNIGGNNFLKLRDMGTAFGFGVDYDDATRTMLVTTK